MINNKMISEEMAEDTADILDQLHGKQRYERGQVIAQTPNAVRKVPRICKWQLWKVASQTDPEKLYSVIDKGNDYYECDCFDFVNRTIICKHIFAVMIKENDEKIGRARPA